MNNEKEIYTERVIPRISIIGLTYMTIPDAKHAFDHLLDWIMADIIDVIPL